MNEQLKKGTYQHYKGNFYEVIGVAKHSETLELMVVYKALYKTQEGNLWVRPLKMFLENVQSSGEIVSRFKFINIK